MTVGYAYDPAMMAHDTGNHPESGRRLQVVLEHLAERGLLEHLQRLAVTQAAPRDLSRVHTTAMIDRIRDLAEVGGGFIDFDTTISRGSYEAACVAAGAAISACRAVLDGQVASAYALVRPPGHHATRQHSMGFCLFNNVAVAAAWALEQGGLSRVAIVDYDVHHGNGTEDILGADPRVLYVSLHQYPFYPGTGHWRDSGEAEGKGSCINIPLPPNTGDRGFAQAMDRIVLPALVRFQPELILVSSGYDGHWVDPLAWMLLSTDGYRHLARLLLEAARKLCAGRIAFVLEGGYHPRALAYSVAGTISELMGRPYEDDLGPSREPEADVEMVLERIAHWHGLETTSIDDGHMDTGRPRS
jgi:acetoin utilization deacetylase AcuC-like enzyme